MRRMEDFEWSSLLSGVVILSGTPQWSPTCALYVYALYTIIDVQYFINCFFKMQFPPTAERTDTYPFGPADITSYSCSEAFNVSPCTQAQFDREQLCMWLSMWHYICTIIIVYTELCHYIYTVTCTYCKSMNGNTYNIIIIIWFSLRKLARVYRLCETTTEALSCQKVWWIKTHWLVTFDHITGYSIQYSINIQFLSACVEYTWTNLPMQHC